MNKKSYKKMSPYLAGICLGVLQVLAIIFAGKMLGLSSSYAAIGAHISNLFISLDSYEWISKYLGPVGSWQLFLAIGIVLGSYVASKKERYLESESYWPSLGYSTARTFVNSFVGGCFLVFGARLAGGCTSGHGISGLSIFSVSSLVTISSMFITATISTFLIRYFSKSKK
jgi:uncharacterized membrane protein YedE/YeeE